MKSERLNRIIDLIGTLCKQYELNFVLVGSVAYSIGVEKSKCDDLDCIIIYDDIKKLHLFPYISKSLYDTAYECLENKTIDLFATKFELEEIKISMDFISIEYLERLAKGRPDTKSEMLKKMTDAIENPLNDYYDFRGNKYIYNKIKYTYRDINIYLLPKFIYIGGVLFTGALYNKFIHNPQIIVLKNERVLELKNNLIKNYVDFYKFQKKIEPTIDIVKSIRNWERFSDESKIFIKRLFD